MHYLSFQFSIMVTIVFVGLLVGVLYIIFGAAAVSSLWNILQYHESPHSAWSSNARRIPDDVPQ
jgi:hypothetical protein